jgi:CrcB protein
MGKSIFAIALGASLGAVLRWMLGLKLNAIHPHVPLGTLTANIIGGYIIGLAIAFFAQMPQLTPEWRLFLITGFCGGLTTFSTFSAEVVNLIQQQRYEWALGAAFIHLLGSLLATFAGLMTWRALNG